MPDKLTFVDRELCQILQPVQYPVTDVEDMFSETDGPKSGIRSFTTFFRANVAELLHHDYVYLLLTEICFGDPGLGLQPSDFDADLAAKVLLRGASWPRLLSGYEEFKPAEGWKRAPFRWELLLAEHFPGVVLVVFQTADTLTQIPSWVKL